MFCKHCGKQISDDARFCDNCGKQIELIIDIQNDTEPVEKSKKVKKPFYKKWFFWFLVAIILLGSFFNAADEVEQIGTDQKSLQVQTKQTTISISQEEEFVVEFCAASGMSDNAAKIAYSMLTEQLHFTEVKFVEKNRVGDMLWTIEGDGYKLYVASDENAVYSVMIPDEFYMYREGSVRTTREEIENKTVKRYRSYYITMAKTTVEKNLKAPSTAEYCDSNDFVIIRNGNIVAVKGYVDSQNSFGAMIRTEFYVQMIVSDVENCIFEVSYIQMGDQSAGTWIEM